jgi:hypothetical protein
VLVGASRSFAVFHDDLLIVPPRQIGIGSKSHDRRFLQALALYLSSDFVTYHQFLTSSQHGVQRAVSTLHALRALPVPLTRGDNTSLLPWEELYGRARRHDNGISVEEFETGKLPDELCAILKDLNELASGALRLDIRQRAAVRDLVHIRLALVDGKVGQAATRAPSRAEIESYARMLQMELDDFLGDDVNARHRIQILCGQQSGMVEIEPVRNTVAAQPITIFEAEKTVAGQFERARTLLRRERSQWVYFDRNLRIYEGAKTYLFKPMRRMHWAESQAMIDASEVIADTLQRDRPPLERVVG